MQALCTVWDVSIARKASSAEMFLRRLSVQAFDGLAYIGNKRTLVKDVCWQFSFQEIASVHLYFFVIN